MVEHCEGKDLQPALTLALHLLVCLMYMQSYMRKTSDVAGKAFLAKKKLAENLA